MAKSISAQARPCEVAFEKDLLLSGGFRRIPSPARSKAMPPSMAPEAAAALAAGKKVKRAKIRITLDDTPWILTLNGENFDWGSLRIEMPPSLPFVEAVPLRLKALEEFQQVFSKLFDHFLSVRLMEDKWPKELKKMKAWVVSKCEPASGGKE